MSQKFYGKYRGMVLNNIDPMQMVRLLVQVPDVLGVGTSSWAMPCVPVAGQGMGLYVLPMVGAGVWVEFEGGEVDYPIWTGGFWGSAAEVPTDAFATTPGLPNIVLQSKNMNTILISDIAAGPTGGIQLKTLAGAYITVNDTGIYINNGQGASITLVGNAVSINNGALMIT
jgi:uncharacterized protein involved in type VI secretion and phage assembly